ncbi:MAG: efflux RND transporter permease subunit [Bacteroides sp.]|nr:efflux RND transporter permease subunit [Bacteroides sp.]MCM1378824.1 efflux RND transporter permease subunit [Bacteroides sp.]MCM1445441.1 efflux RND transporter permease subunit [Prevotella sp.]
MTRITRFFIERPTLFWSLMCGILIMGVLSFMRMPKLEDPVVPVKQASVIVLYPGADVETMERDIAAPLEDALRTLPDIDELKTNVYPGQVLVSVNFEMGTPKDQLEQHFDLVRRKAMDIQKTLPQGAMEPIVVDDMMDVYGLLYAFTGDGYSLKELETYAKELRRELVAIEGVKRVNIGGKRSEVIDIELTPEQIKRNGLLPTQIMIALQGASGAVDAGKSQAGDSRLTLTVTEGVTSVDDVANLLIDTPEGKQVRLGDIARVERRYAEPHRNAIYVGGAPALTIAITLEDNAIVPDVGAIVDEKIAEVLTRFPVGMQTEKIYFQPDKVNSAISGFMLNLLESVVIVVLILILSMGWRSGVIIGFGLVLTVALSFPLLQAVGTTLQRISLGAFIVAMGMLVDNAVVIMDGILVDRDRGLPQERYLYRIGKNTALPLLGATVIAACTFLPIYLTPGSVGEFAGDLFMVICVSLLASWVLALIQVPACAKAWLGSHNNKEIKELESKYPQGKVYRLMHKALLWLLGHKAVAICCAIVLLGVSALGISRLRIVFFPDFDYEQFVVECYFPNTTDADSVDARIRQMAATVEEMPDVNRVVVSTGGAPARYCFVRPMPDSDDTYAELIIDCKDFKTMQRMTHEIRRKLRDIAPDAYVRTRKYNFSIVSSHTVEVEFSGPDANELRRLSAQAEEIMRSSKWVDPYSVQNNWKITAPTLQFNFSQSAAQRAGVSRSDVAHALQSAVDGYPVGVLSEGDNMLPIRVAMRESSGAKPTDLEAIAVWSTANVNLDPSALQGLMTGATSADELRENMFRTTLLGNVVDSTSLRYASEHIYRYNGQRAIQAECDPDPENPEATPAKVVADIEAKIKAIPLPPGYSIRFVGEGELSNKTIGKVMGLLPTVLLIVFAVLLMLFNNWKKLFVILLCFPFVMCGIIPSLLLTDTPFTFLAILGCMGLIGMMVKNAIVLVDEINRLQTDEQVEAFEAVVRATLSRVRPVMLASFTTILGMIPLIGDAMYGSLAITVIGGLAVGTIITLLLLPLLYSIFFNIKK